MSTGSRLIAVALVILALCMLRFVHLGADTPPGASPTGVGLYVDEGYKTLSARRLVLFGATRWDEADRFSGWMEESPLTQWSFYAGFQLLGANVESARVVTILYFALFLAGYAWAFWHRYSGAVFWATASNPRRTSADSKQMACSSASKLSWSSSDESKVRASARLVARIAMGALAANSVASSLAVESTASGSTA